MNTLANRLYFIPLKLHNILIICIIPTRMDIINLNIKKKYISLKNERTRYIMYIVIRIIKY